MWQGFFWKYFRIIFIFLYSIKNKNDNNTKTLSSPRESQFILYNCFSLTNKFNYVLRMKVTRTNRKIAKCNRKRISEVHQPINGITVSLTFFIIGRKIVENRYFAMMVLQILPYTFYLHPRVIFIIHKTTILYNLKQYLVFQIHRYLENVKKSYNKFNRNPSTP